MNILEQIALSAKERVKAKKSVNPLETVKEQALSLCKNTLGNTADFPFETSLKQRKLNGIAFICEVKKASPSKGDIAVDFDYIKIAKEYEQANAAAISVLTEPERFKGSDVYLKEISACVNSVKTPLLRKDFTVDEYMIYEAKLLGASAVLLICSILSEDVLAEYIRVSDLLGLSALVETHDEEEVKTAISAGARIIGVNNRNLKTFEVDITLSERLRKSVPDDIIFVAESGISTPEDVQRLRQANVDAVLIGETLMRAKNKKEEILRLCRL